MLQLLPGIPFFQGSLHDERAVLSQLEVHWCCRGHNIAVDIEKGINLIVRTSDVRVSSRLDKVLVKKDPNVRVIRLNMKIVDDLRTLLKNFKTCHGEHGRSFTGGEAPSAGLSLIVAFSHVCEKLRLYGFGRPKYKGKLVPYQYFTEYLSNGSVNQVGTTWIQNDEMTINTRRLLRA